MLGCDRAGDCGAGGVDPVDRFSVSIAFEQICGARGDGGGVGVVEAVEREVCAACLW